MSDAVRRPGATTLRIVLLSVGLSLAAGVVRAASTPEAARILARVDRSRSAWPEAVFRLKVTVARPGEEARAGLFLATVKGTKLRVDFLDAGEEGKAFVSLGDEAWFVMPRARAPVKVPKSARLTGGFSAAELMRTRFDEEYEGVVERSDVLDGRECDVLRLAARPGRSPAWPLARLWVDRREGLLRRAVFLVASGKTARDVAFEGWREWGGLPAPSRLTIVDTLRAGTTIVEYLSAERREVPDSAFDLSRRSQPPTPRAGPGD
jgi:hypothetical protein